MPASQTTRSSASPLHRATVASSSPSSTTPHTTRSGRPKVQLQQQTQHLSHISSNDEGSPATAGQSPVSPGRGECALEGRISTSNGLSFGRMSSTIPSNLSADVATGATYSGNHITTPTHGMAQSQLQMNEHEAAMMAGNKSMGAPTPTSTSSYGAKDEGGYGTASGRGVGSEFGGTDDDYGGGLIGAGGMGDAGMHGQVSPHYGQEGGEYEGGLDIAGDTGDRNGVEESSRDGFKMKSEGEGQESMGPWAETKTKAGKERKRLPLACIMCRRKKIRCSGEKPACKHCLRSRIPCVYKQTARKTVPRTDYMSMLDRRLKRMEERLLKCVPKDEINATLANTGRSVVKPAITTAGKKRSADMAFEDELNAWGYSGPKAKRHLEGTGLGAPSLARDAATVDMDDGSHTLPSKDIQEHLAEVFFDCVYGQPYFLLHKPSFMRRLRTGTAPPVLVLALCAVSARFSKHPAVRHEPSFLAGECFASEARRQLLKNFDTPNITNLTVCILLGLHEFGTCHGGRSWALGGMATRMAHALQLHKEAEQDPMGKVHPLMRLDYIHEGGLMGGYMSFTDKEIRRRCMWACFVMDRFNSSGTERPCMINEGEIEIQLPVHDRNLQLDAPAITEQLDGGVKDASDIPEEEKLRKASESMGIGAYMVRVVAIFGRVVKYLNQGGKEKEAHDIWDTESVFNELNAELQHFMDDLPAAFRYTVANVELLTAERTLPQLVFVHVAYHQVRLFLNRSTLSMARDGSKSSMPEFLRLARETALDAAAQIAQILHDAQERGVSVFAPFTGYCAFNASLVHLVRMFHPEDEVQLEAKRHMEVCLQFLLQLKQYWGLFRSITDQLKMLYQKFSARYSRGSPEAGHAEVARMLQYGDWFTKYPQGFPPGEFEEYAPKSLPPSDDAALSHRPDLQTASEFFARLGPRTDTRPKSLPAAIKHPEPFMPDARGSPVGRVQSPMAPSSNPVQQQSSGLHAPAMALNTSSMVPSPVDIPSKLDAHAPAGHDRGESMARASPSYGGAFTQPSTAAQLTSPLSGHMPVTIPAPSQFSSYHPPQVMTPQPSSVGFGHHHHHHHHHDPHHDHRAQQHDAQTSQPPPPPPYLYDSYTSGSDTSLIAALSSSLWQGFDQSIGNADVCAFPENQSSAWFVPFNSVPDGGFETEDGGLEALGMLASGVGVGRGGLPPAEAGGAALSAAAAAAARGRGGSTAVANRIIAGGHPGSASGYHRQQQVQQTQQQQ